MKNIIAGCSILFSFCWHLNAQKQFTNNGNFKIHSNATVSFFGDFINNGTFVDSGQVISLSGSSSQNIGGTSLTTFKNLTLNNAAGSYLSANEAIIGALTISLGTFSTTGYDFTLISDANGTARIAPITGDFSGNITMQRYLGSGPSSWRFLSTPVQGATINDWQDDFVTSGFPGSLYPGFNFVSIYTYDETVSGIADNGYNVPSTSSDPIDPGKGYWCYIGPTPLTVDVTGPPAKFSQTFSVSYTSSGGPSEDGYVMIGNPYPSAIDWSSANWTKSKINDAIYIWNPVLQQYASWVSGVSTNGGSNIIASSQSFWIQTNGSVPSLACDENVKVATDKSFIRPSGSPAFSASGTLKLNMHGNNFVDETILRFGNGATNGYDSDSDARKLFSSNLSVPGIASLDSTQKDMSVNSLPEVNSSLHIPVKTLVGVAGTYTIERDSLSVMPDGFCIVLEDLATGIQTNMNNLTTYTFFISDTTSAPRFLLHISAPHETKSISASCNNYQDGKAIAVAKGDGPWNYKWVDVSNTLKITNASFLPDTLANLAAGDYSVYISGVTGICGSFFEKVTITEPVPVYAAFTLNKDTVYAGTLDSLLLENTSSGAISYTWNFGDGSPVEISALPSPHHYMLPGSYTVSQIASNMPCSDTLHRKITVLPANLVGMSKNEKAFALKIYPNPGRGEFFVSLDHSHFGEVQLEILTITGQTIYQAVLNSDTTQIKLHEQARGIYFYRLKQGSELLGQGKFINE